MTCILVGVKNLIEKYLVIWKVSVKDIICSSSSLQVRMSYNVVGCLTSILTWFVNYFVYYEIIVYLLSLKSLTNFKHWEIEYVNVTDNARIH